MFFFPQQMFQISVSGSTPFPDLGEEEQYFCGSNGSAFEPVELMQHNGTMSCSFSAVDEHLHGDMGKQVGNFKWV
jgi:hypothetical protein